MINNKTMKAMVTQLTGNNDNQREFLASLRVVAGQLMATSFLTRGRSRFRTASRSDLMRPTTKIKLEGKNDDVSTKTTTAPSSSLSGTSSLTPIVIDDFGDLDADDVEAAVMGDFPIFLAIDSLTEPESHADTVTRMKLYQQLVLATPHHVERTRTCPEGDCYGFLKLILRNVIVTGQSRYKTLMALQTIKFGANMTVSELVTSLKDVQAKANRLKKDAIDDDVMKGALLSLAQGHSKFERLATDFSKRSVEKSFDEIVDELLAHETNINVSNLGKPPPTYPHQQLAQLMDETTPSTEAIYELAAVLARTLGPPNQQTGAEACRNFQRGRCQRAAADCKYSHSPGNPSGNSSASGAKTGERKKITCYNCQKLGFHVASDCTEPKQERRRPRGATNEQANHADEAGATPSVDVASFMKQFLLLSKQLPGGKKQGAEDGEHACMVVEELGAITANDGHDAPSLLYSSIDDDAGAEELSQGALDTLSLQFAELCHAVTSNDKSVPETHDQPIPNSAASHGQSFPIPNSAASHGLSLRNETHDPAFVALHAPSLSPCESETHTGAHDSDAASEETANVLTEVAYNAANQGAPDKPNTVLLDSAASSHYLLASDAPLSSSGRIQTDTKVKVNGAQKGSGMECLGKMACKLELEGGAVKGRAALHLDRVLLLPESLRHRLASVGQLTRGGYGLMFIGDQCSVAKDGAIVLTAKRTANNLYPMHATNLPAAVKTTPPQGEHAMLAVDENGDTDEQCYLASAYYAGANFAQRCHVKFNHASVAKGSALHTKLATEYGRRFTDCPAFSCTDCLFSKVHRLPHPRRSNSDRARHDGGGPVGKVSLDSFSWPYAGDKGEKVGTIMTDRRQLIPIATRTRDETPARIIVRLKQLNKLAMHAKSLEVSTEIFKVTFGEQGQATEEGDEESELAHIHYLKTDGAAEFMGGELTTFCEEHGIEKKASCGHTQQQNPGEPAVKLVTQGIALLHRQLPLKSKWVYAFRFFCRVYGFMPNTGLPAGYDTPYEAVQQRKVPFKDLTKHVHPYGCLCFLHIPKALRAHTHGVDKGMPCANLGFSVTKEGFVVLALDSHTVIDGVWDVFFVEDRFPIAELHEARLLQGVPIVKQQVTRRWLGVDLSWHALTTGNYANEPAMDLDAEQDVSGIPAEEEEVGSRMKTEPALGAAIAASTPTVAPLPASKDGLTDWAGMPRLEPAALPDLSSSNTAVPESTMLQIKSAIRQQQNKPTRVAAVRPTSGVRRSTRARQPSNESLIALANLPPSAPSSLPPTTREMDGHEDSLGTPSPSNSVDLDECAMLTCVQKEAEAAYKADTAAMPAPERYADAMRRGDKENWRTAMHAHLMKLRRIGEGVYRLVPRSEALNVMKSSWVFARKVRAHHEDGQLLEDSARAVAGGYSQEYGVDYLETYCPTMPLESYKINEAECLNTPGSIREEYDFSGAYYQSFPTLKQYMEQPPGMGETPESYAAIDLDSKLTPAFAPAPGARSKYVWELLRCMPGTKDAGHNFNEQMTEYLVEKLKLVPNPADTASFYGQFGDSWIRLNTYVDDLTAFSNSQKLLDKCHDLIHKRFPAKRLAGINLIVGVTVSTTPTSIEFDQKRLITDAAEYTGQCEAGTERTPYPSGWAGFTDADLVTDPVARAVLDKFPYPNAVGKVAYVARSTRYECLWIVSVLQRHFKNFGPAMIKALLRLVRYLYTTRSKRLIFRKGYPNDLHPVVTMVDASYGSSLIDGSSHESHLTFYKGCCIQATSKRQRTVALSSMESEFMGANSAAKTALWTNKLLRGFGIKAQLPFPILEDNTAAIYLSRKPNLNGSRTRHMEVRWHWLQQQVMDKKAILHHLRTHFQLADLMTKVFFF